ncbi:MAG: hypothetical protein AVDCRST_MAG24-1627, partial [uncultured Nocardioidaceae bacterium]
CATSRPRAWPSSTTSSWVSTGTATSRRWVGWAKPPGSRTVRPTSSASTTASRRRH